MHMKLCETQHMNNEVCQKVRNRKSVASPSYFSAQISGTLVAYWGRQYFARRHDGFLDAWLLSVLWIKLRNVQRRDHLET